MAGSSKSYDPWADFPSELAPERMSYVPHTNRRTFALNYRDLQMVDAPQVVSVLAASGVKVSKNALIRFIQATGWSARGAFRNKNTMVALVLSQHLATGAPGESNEIKILWVHPDYALTNVPQRLLLLARLELPELPTKCRPVGRFAADTGDILRTAGWTEVDDCYHAPSVGRREYRAALQASGITRQPAAVREPG